jgi:hypothetical protein
MHYLKSTVSSVTCICALFIVNLPAIAAQSNGDGMNVEAVASQMNSEWKQVERSCDQYSRSKISNVSVISGTTQIKSRGKTFVSGGKEIKVIPVAFYLKASYPSATSDRPTYATYGPVQNSAKSSDFKSLVGMPYCDEGSGD